MSNRGGDNTSKYDAGHILGTIHLNIYKLEQGYPTYPYTCAADGNLLADADLQTFIENMGITQDTLVIIYGYGGGSTACRTAWALMYAGVQDVRILNGGYPAWKEYGGAIETSANTPTPVPFGATVPVHPEYLATTPEVQGMLDNQNAAIGDNRAWKEHIGESNPYYERPEHLRHAGFDAYGRIPGGKWVENIGWYYDADGTFKSYTEVRKEWQDAGVTSDKRVAFHCGTGWRSSTPFFYAHLMGYPDVANYDGGFYEWSTWNPANPIDAGE
jgi:thiosulfate/3-mercaptopyruvate sulfurtransferase